MILLQHGDPCTGVKIIIINKLHRESTPTTVLDGQHCLLDAPPNDSDGRRSGDAARGRFLDLEQSRSNACQGHIMAGHAPGAEVLVQADGAEDGAVLAQNAQVLDGRGVCVGDGAALCARRQAEYGEALVVSSRHDGVP